MIDQRTERPMTVALAGELVFERQAELDRCVQAFRESDASSLLLDLSQVSFVDSTGLRILFSLMAIAEQRGGRVTLSGVSPTVARTLDLVGAFTLFETG